MAQVSAKPNLSRDIDELKASMTHLIKLGKGLQSLSSHLASIAETCKSVNTTSSQIQSAVAKMSASIDKIESQQTETQSDSVWLYPQPKTFPAQCSLKTKDTQDLTKNFQGHLNKLELNKNVHVKFDIYQVLFNFLYVISQHKGYVFGGFVRDFLVPVTIFGQSIDQRNFKDIDIWFAKQEDADAFISRLYQDPLVDMKPDPYDPHTAAEYGCGHSYKRNKYHFYYDDVPMFLVDVVVADKLPVNDFAVNLLMFQAREQSMANIDSSWFQVGCNYANDWVAYSVECLIQHIGNHGTRILSTYGYPNSIKDNNYKRIITIRTQKMLDAGWTLSLL